MSLKSTLRAILTLGRGVTTGLLAASANRDPIELFGEWFREAERAGIMLPEAMTLATCTKDGTPSARMVLLKGFDARGFVFYTNFQSRKGQEVEANPRAALVFHWTVLERQVRIEGTVARVTDEESYAYFRTRFRGSRIGAWASKQSDVLESRDAFAARVAEVEQKFSGVDVPLPPFWGGLRVVPDALEFWQGRVNRLHDRLCFQRQGESWTTRHLYP